ncbi:MULTISPECIES: motility associated factor glycosyltransferase family protein [unclassified Lysinibacillus]|uniref:motility associated factor glycosyltransferase family protein n=1 Tax=unclassified Lysinibacillus TaxID=2636778 RepID=UPI0037F3CF57
MELLKIKSITAKDGNETFEVNGYLLHSKYNPNREAESLIKKEINKNYVNVILGFGRGYLADALVKEEISNDKILFIEPITAFERFDTKQYDIVFGDNLDTIQEAIEGKLRFFSRKINVICAPNYDKIFHSLYVNVLKKVKDIQNLNIVYNNTIKDLSVTWQENSIRNMLPTYINGSLNVLEKYYNCPVIVASGGPSLTKQLNLLKEIRKNVVLIAAGSTVNTLITHNIEPDYIITIDGSEINYDSHFKDLKVKSAELMYASTSHYKIQQNFKNRQYAFLDTRENKYKEHVNKTLGIDLPNILGGGSVANFALSIARYLSTGPIALIGQDLAYTEGKTHAEGNKNLKAADTTFLTFQGAFEIEGYYGEKVMTDYSLFSMKESFEEIMRQIEDPNTIFNCTEGGLKIMNIQQKSFEQFCHQFVDRNSKVKLYNLNENKKDLAIYISSAREEIRIYRNINLELKLAQQALEKNTLSTEFAPSILKTLDDVDIKVAKLMKKVVMERINDPITLDVMTNYEAQGEETPEQKYQRVYEQNKELYDRLSKATEQSIQYTLDAIREAEELKGE